MANLTSQQIKDTYPGLLNLNTATSGITSTPQAITDGLGNDTGSKIGTNFFSAPTMLGVNNFTPDYGGVGFGNNNTAPVAGTQNVVQGQMFYDTGLWAYSGMSYWSTSATSTSDVVTVAFYSTQYIDGYGYAPKDLIQSGTTLSSNLGAQFTTTTLPSTLSFSGNGPGFYWMLYKISNSGVTPTVRYSSPQAVSTTGFIFNTAGLVRRPDGNGTSLANKNNGSTVIQIAFGAGLNTFQTSYTPAQINANAVYIAQYIFGWALKTAK
jgi:hypothetical protein